MRVPAMTPDFADLRVITATAGCIRRAAGAWTLASPTCDPFGRPYNYPSIWARGLAWAGAGESATHSLGIGLFGVFVLLLGAMAWLAQPAGWDRRAVLVLLLAGVSPPALLAVERGNSDIVVVALVLGAAVASRPGARSLAATLVAAAGVLKLFPFGAGLMFVARARRRALTWLVVLGGAGIAWEFSELRLIVARTPQSSQVSFGDGVIPRLAWTQLGLPGGVTVWRAVGLLLFLGSAVVWALALRLRRSDLRVVGLLGLVRAVQGDEVASALLLGGGGCFLGAYAVGTSWDYRLIFLLPVLAGLVRVRGSAPRPVSWACAAIVAELYVTYPLGAPQHVGDLAWLVLAPLMLVVLVLVARGRPPGRTVGTPTSDAAAQRDEKDARETKGVRLTAAPDIVTQ